MGVGCKRCVIGIIGLKVWLWLEIGVGMGVGFKRGVKGIL